MRLKQTLSFRLHSGLQAQYEAEPTIVSPRDENILWSSEPRRFVVLYFDHHQAMRRHGGPGLRAVSKFVQTIDIRMLLFRAPDVLQGGHLSPAHIAKERT